MSKVSIKTIIKTNKLIQIILLILLVPAIVILSLTVVGFQRFLIRFYDNVPTIIAVIGLAVTVILSNQEYEKKKSLFKTTVVVLIILLTPSIMSLYICGKKSVVPNIMGTSYDEALQTLRESGLDGNLVLATTNKDLNHSDARVVWQSDEADSVVGRGSTIAFAIDDSFSVEYIPLIPSDNIEKKYISWSYVTGEGAEEPIWTIRINLFYGVPLNQQVPIYNDNGSINGYYYAQLVWRYMPINIDAKAMGEIIDKILESFVNEYAESLAISNIEDYYEVVKLQPVEGTPFELTRIDRTNGVYFIPNGYSQGDYLLSFCFVNGDLEYQWSHLVKIITAGEDEEVQGFEEVTKLPGADS